MPRPKKFDISTFAEEASENLVPLKKYDETKPATSVLEANDEKKTSPARETNETATTFNGTNEDTSHNTLQNNATQAQSGESLPVETENVQPFSDLETDEQGRVGRPYPDAESNADNEIHTVGEDMMDIYGRVIYHTSPNDAYLQQNAEQQMPYMQGQNMGMPTGVMPQQGQATVQQGQIIMQHGQMMSHQAQVVQQQGQPGQYNPQMQNIPQQMPPQQMGMQPQGYPNYPQGTPVNGYAQQGQPQGYVSPNGQYYGPGMSPYYSHPMQQSGQPMPNTPMPQQMNAQYAQQMNSPMMGNPMQTQMINGQQQPQTLNAAQPVNGQQLQGMSGQGNNGQQQQQGMSGQVAQQIVYNQTPQGTTTIEESAKSNRGRKKSLRTIPRQNGKVVFLEVEADAALARISILQRVDKQDIIRTALDEFLKTHYDGNDIDAIGAKMLTDYIKRTTEM